MNTCTKVLVLFALSGAAAAGDLVLKLGTSGNYRYHRIPVTGSVTISPATGDITVDPVADAGTSSDGWCPSGGTSGSNLAFASSLQSSTSSLPSGGGTVQLSWSTTGGNAAVTCTASSSGVSGWNGNTVTSPTSINLAASGNYSFSLSCTDGTATISSSAVSVTVQTASTGPNPECSTRPAITAATRQTSMINYNLNGALNQQNIEFPLNGSVNISGYIPLFGTVFNQTNQVARLFLDTGKYASLAFDTGTVAVGAAGQVAWNPASSATFTVQISPCVGDFDYVTDPMCKRQAAEESINWKVGPKPTSNPGPYCYVDANKTYYINVIGTVPPNWGTTTCDSAYCTWLVSVGGF